MRTQFSAVALVGVSLFACAPIQTRNTVVIEQPKPLEVNVNLSGRLELVITDARKDLETITGQKAKREVRPEDIGLPPDNSGAAATTVEGMDGMVTLVSYPGETPRASAVATEEELVKSMAARNAKVRGLLSAKVAGEAHTGLLVEKGTLTADQKGTLEAENADRTQLYQLRAAQNGTTPAQAALAYYLQRLGYAQAGDWVEKYNKGTKEWEWVKWAG